MESTATAEDDLCFPDGDGFTPLMRAIKERREGDALQIIRTIPHNSLLNIHSTSDDKTALHLAVENSLTRCVQLLLRLSASVDRKDNKGNTPLHVACSLGDANILKTLLVNAKDEGQKVPAFHLCYLLDTCNNDGFTCFHLAVNSGYSRAIRIVADFGADVNAKVNITKDKYRGWTALHMAAHGGNILLVECLVKYTNVDLDQRTPDGSSALDLASDEKYVETADFLKELQTGEPGQHQQSFRVSASDSDDSPDVSLWDVHRESMMRPALTVVQASKDGDSVHLLARENTQLTIVSSSDDSLEGAVGYTRKELYVKDLQIFPDKNKAGNQPHHVSQKPSLLDNPVEKVVGLAILLNILRFPSGTPQRKASIGLAGEFRSTFTEYGYVQKVLVKEAQTKNAEKIQYWIKTFLERSAHRLTEDSCIFTWVCSHGRYGTVICSDGTELPITVLMEAVKGVITLLKRCTLLFLICACQEKYPIGPRGATCPYFEAAEHNTLVMVAAGPKQVDFEVRNERVVATVNGKTKELLVDESGNTTAVTFLEEMNNAHGSPLVMKLWKRVKAAVTAKHPRQEGHEFPRCEFSKKLRIPRKGVPPF